MKSPLQLLSQIFGRETNGIIARAGKAVPASDDITFPKCDPRNASDRELVDHIQERMELIGFRCTNRSASKVGGVGPQGIAYTRDHQKPSPFPEIMMIPISPNGEMLFMDQHGRLIYADAVTNFLQLKDTRDMRAAIAVYREHLRREAYIRSFR